MSIKEMLYNRNATLYDVDSIPTVHVVGVGGIGSWTAISFAMAGAKEVHVYDDDNLGVSNLNRLPFTLKDVGKPKTAVVKAFIKKLRPDCKVVTHGTVQGPENLKVSPNDLVVICVDSAEQNNAVLAATDGTGARVLRGAYNEDRITVQDAGPQWGEGAGYGVVVPSYLVPPMMVAALLVEKALRSPKIDIASKPIAEIA